MSNSRNKVTLEEYLQAHKIQKKLQYRNKSKSKGKNVGFELEQEQSIKSIFGLMDHWTYELKLDFQQYLEKNQSIQKASFHWCILLDKLVLKLKEQIKKMYKEISVQYTMDCKSRITGEGVQYFNDKKEEAVAEVKKMHLAQMMRENFKSAEKSKELIAVMFDNNLKLKRLNSLDKKDQPTSDNGGFMEALIGLGQQSQPQQHLGRQNNHLRPSLNPSNNTQPTAPILLSSKISPHHNKR